MKVDPILKGLSSLLVKVINNCLYEDKDFKVGEGKDIINNSLKDFVKSFKHHYILEDNFNNVINVVFMGVKDLNFYCNFFIRCIFQL